MNTGSPWFIPPWFSRIHTASNQRSDLSKGGCLVSAICLKTVLNSEGVLFLKSYFMYWIGLGTEVAVLNSQVVPISQVVLKTGFTVYSLSSWFQPIKLIINW